jgi:hypothetical protein
LYGLDSRVDNGYKLKFDIKRKVFQPDYVVIENHTHLQQIIAFINQQGIKGVRKKAQI